MQGRVTQLAKWTFLVSSGIIVVCFLPWTNFLSQDTVQREAYAVAAY